MRKILILFLAFILVGCTEEIEWQTCTLDQELFVNGRQYYMEDYNDLIYKEVDNVLYIKINQGTIFERDYVIHGDYAFICKN